MGNIFTFDQSAPSILPIELIENILTIMLLNVSHKKLLRHSLINKFCYNKINNTSFKNLRYNFNPAAHDSRTDLMTSALINYMINTYKSTNHKYSHQDNSIFIELNEKYYHVYQKFEITEEEFISQCSYNKARIQHGITWPQLASLQICYHGPNSRRKFTIQFDNGTGCYSSSGGKMVDADLYDALFRIVFFRDINIYIQAYTSRAIQFSDINNGKIIIDDGGSNTLFGHLFLN
jgi:hypothetical protein